MKHHNLFLSITILSLHAEPKKTDVQLLGLKGSVKTYKVETAAYKASEGDRILQTAYPTLKLDFSEKGYKTEESSYQYQSSRESRHISYSYNADAALVERKEF